MNTGVCIVLWTAQFFVVQNLVKGEDFIKLPQYLLVELDQMPKIAMEVKLNITAQLPQTFDDPSGVIPRVQWNRCSPISRTRTSL